MPDDTVTVLNGRVKLKQSAHGFRTSLDSIMLAAGVPPDMQGNILDLGCGVGGAGLSCLWRLPDCRLTGVDFVPEYIGLAHKNASINNVSERCRFVCDDIIHYTKSLEKPIFDCVICNPPFYDQGAYVHSPTPEKDMALGQTRDIESWIKAVLYSLKNGGVFCLVHRADMLDRILALLDKRFGATDIVPLWPREGAKAKRIVVRAIKGRRSPCTVHQGLTLHDAQGQYTEAANRILRDGQTLID